MVSTASRGSLNLQDKSLGAVLQQLFHISSYQCIVYAAAMPKAIEQVFPERGVHCTLPDCTLTENIICDKQKNTWFQIGSKVMSFLLTTATFLQHSNDFMLKINLFSLKMYLHLFGSEKSLNINTYNKNNPNTKLINIPIYYIHTSRTAPCCINHEFGMLQIGCYKIRRPFF